ncbi:MAG: hypothetical protein JRJ19_10100 [Deltaproteobacteria bacterium]|nr:hypothetical protein [Deltaproteobacteria bacterium]
MSTLKKLTIGIVLLMFGCSGGDAFFIKVVFPEGAKDLASRVRVVAVIPSATANCAALEDGSAAVGSQDYQIEDELTFGIPVTEDIRPLDVAEPGRRLFYAEAENSDSAVFVRGCTEAEAGGAGVQEVTINLDWIGETCDSDADCEDLDDGQWCNGVYRCTDRVCQLELTDCTDNDPCTQDICNEVTDVCEHPLVTNPPAEENLTTVGSCSDGIDNDCDGLTDADDLGCKSCTEDIDCDDNNDCTDDSCVNDNCVNQDSQAGSVCSDGLECT